MNYLIVERRSIKSSIMYMLEDIKFDREITENKKVLWKPLFSARDFNGTESEIDPEKLLKNEDAHLWFHTEKTKGLDVLFAQVQGCELTLEERMATDEADADVLGTVSTNADIREYIEVLFDNDQTQRVHLNEDRTEEEEANEC